MKKESAVLVSEQRGLMGTSLERLIGKRSANQLAKLGLNTVNDVLMHVPFRLARRGELMPIEAVREGEAVTVVARVLNCALRPMHARRGFILNVTISDGERDLELTFFAKNPRPLTFHQKQLHPGTVAAFSGTITSYRGTLQLTHPEYHVLESENTVDAQTLARPLPIYHASASVPSWKIEQVVALILPRVKPEDIPDPLPANFRAAHSLLSKIDAVRELHQPTSPESWDFARRRMAYEEAFVLQTVLARSRAAARAIPAPLCPWRSDGAAEAFESRLPFTLTSGQCEVSKEIQADIACATPMRRLLQGDVGTGKTIVALRAMLQVIDAGGQAVLLAPTEVLARQHIETFQTLLGPLGKGGQLGAPPKAVTLELFTGSLCGHAKQRALARLASGEAQLIVGTHALLYDNVQFANLAFVVVDEQHRFGVNQRDTLAEGAHLLVMTATPIPRTIAMTTFGDLDVSTLSDVPTGRATITTVLVPAWNTAWMSRVWERAVEEVTNDGRVYVVCPRITASTSDTGNDDTADSAVRTDGAGGASVEDTVDRLSRETALAQAGIAIGMMHGQMDAEQKAIAMERFVNGQTPVLVATTVIEVGIDVPEATMMVICDADRFGLSQLHQLRGRIGRGSKPGVCLAVHEAADGTLARERLEAFASTTNGFVLAEKDVELRSEGDVLGAAQSGGHTSLRFLSVLRDATIIEQAKRAASEVVAADPQLAEPSHAALASAVTKIEATAEADYLERG